MNLHDMTPFAAGLEVTGIGMALVFLTLIIVAVFIWLLDKAFRPSEEAEEAAAPVAAAPAAAPVAAAVDDTDEVAAIMAAIAAERAKRAPATASMASSMPAPTWDDEEVVGEVVTVATIDSGAGTWRGFSRLKAM